MYHIRVYNSHETWSGATSDTIKLNRAVHACYWFTVLPVPELL